MASFTEILALRQEATRRLLASTKHLDREELVFMLLCHVPVEKLETTLLEIIRDANPRGLIAVRSPRRPG